MGLTSILDKKEESIYVSWINDPTYNDLRDLL